MGRDSPKLLPMVSAVKRKVVGVYLAAGSSRRMGTAKQSLEMAEGVRLGGDCTAACTSFGTA